LLLVGFAGAFRRSELVDLDVGDLEDRHEGLVVTIRRSKTDQDAAGRQVGLPYGSNPATCPVRTLRAWLDLAGITNGPLYRPVDRHGKIAGSRLSARRRQPHRAAGRAAHRRRPPALLRPLPPGRAR